MSGRRPPIAYVMGPSGAGKDTLLRQARALLAGEAIIFAHRYITREPVAGDENFIALSEAEFTLRQARGLFAFNWSAHETRYAIGAEIELWRASGLTVVVSGSRGHFQSLADTSQLRPIVITASPAVLARRLEARGREGGTAIAERLARGEDMEVAHPSLVTIVNDHAVEIARGKLVEALRAIR